MRLLALLLLALASNARAEPRELLVLAAASLEAPLRQTAHEFEKQHPGTRLAFDFASTGVLRRQLQAGAPADVFLPADDELKDGVAFARNTLVLVAPANSSMKSIDDLRTDEIHRLGIGDPRLVPAGQYAKELLEHEKLYQALRPKLVFGANVTQVLTWVRTGNVDAAFVYASDLSRAHGEVRVVAAPDKTQYAPIIYRGGVAAQSTQPEVAKAYLDFLASPQVQRAFAANGFAPP